MNLEPTLLALALVSLPLVSHAQSTAPSVVLTRPGVFATPAETLADGMAVVDRQPVDVDGDGDLDLLVLVDLAEDAEVKPDSGRGVAVLFHEAGGWHAETVASVQHFPLEAGYNWGAVESLRTGAPPLVHLLYSQATPGGTAAQQDHVLWFDHGAFRAVFAGGVESSPMGTRGAVVRTLNVHARDLNGDGTSELLEHVREQRAHARHEHQRVFRWDGATRSFVETVATLPVPRRLSAAR